MARFRKRKFFRKPDSSPNDTKKLEKEEIQSVITEDNPTQKTKSVELWIRSGTKYIFIIITAALLSGVFNGLTQDTESNHFLYGIIIIFVGIAGGVITFKGIKREYPSTTMVLVGVSMMIISTIIIIVIGDSILL